MTLNLNFTFPVWIQMLFTSERIKADQWINQWRVVLGCVRCTDLCKGSRMVVSTTLLSAKEQSESVSNFPRVACIGWMSMCHTKSLGNNIGQGEISCSSARKSPKFEVGQLQLREKSSWGYKISGSVPNNSDFWIVLLTSVAWIIMAMAPAILGCLKIPCKRTHFLT